MEGSINLRGYDLSDCNFSGTNLVRTSLAEIITNENSNFTKTRLDRNQVVSLHRSGYRRFHEVNVKNVNLSGLSIAGLTDADFTRANFKNTKFNFSTTTNIIFTEIKHNEGTSFEGSRLTQEQFIQLASAGFSNFRNATLEEMNLSNTRLNHDEFVQFYLTGHRNFRGATLVDVDFPQLNIASQDLEALLQGVKLVKPNLTNIQLPRQ